jgi:ribosomal protein S17
MYHLLIDMISPRENSNYVCIYFNFLLIYMKIQFFFFYFRDVEIGDVVTIGECRPLSKTVRFNVLKVTKGSSSKKSFKKF